MRVLLEYGSEFLDLEVREGTVDGLDQAVCLNVYHEDVLCDRYITGGHHGVVQIAGQVLTRFAGYGPELEERKETYRKAGVT